MKHGKDDLDTIYALIDTALANENLEIALQGAQVAILNQIRITLHKAYKHGWTTTDQHE